MRKIIKKSLPGILSGIFVAVVASVSAWVWQSYNTSRTTLTKILTAKAGISVAHMIMLKGSYANTHKNSDLWIVVQPQQSPNYHPQPSIIPKQSNNRWTAIAYLGSSKTTNSGENFIIHLVTANMAALKAFKNYLLNSARSSSWAGLSDLPSGVTIIDTVNVIRQ